MSARMPSLSKSRIAEIEQCAKRLWLSVGKGDGARRPSRHGGVCRRLVDRHAVHDSAAILVMQR